MDYSSRLSERIRNTRASATVALADRAAEMSRQGIDVISLAAGEPDFPPPARVVEGAHRALDAGYTHYTSSLGLGGLRDGIGARLRSRHGLDYDPATEILVTPGAKQAIYYIAQVLLEPGLEALCPEPAWVSYPECIALAQGRYVPIPTDKAAGFRITGDALEAAWTKAARLLILNTPSNPTGHVLSASELELLGDFARRHDLIVLSDEIYEDLVFDGQVHRSIAVLDGMRERTLLVSGFSKCFAMTGFRLGYVAGPAGLIREFNKLQQHSATCPTAFAQQSLVGVMDQLDEDVARMVAVFARRRERLCAALQGIPGVVVRPPEGAFYLFLDISALDRPSSEVAMELLETAHLAVTPGLAFGASGEGHLRISFAMDEDRLLEAASRIRKTLGGGEA